MSDTKLSSAGPVDATLIENLVAASRILAHHGVLDAWGHVSMRHPSNPQRYLMSRARAPAMVSIDDIMEFDLDSNPVDQRDRRCFLEPFIHGCAYKARPDVNAVVHSHSPTVIPYTVTGEPLKAISHIASFLAGGCPCFEIRDVGLTQGLLVTNQQQGRGRRHRAELPCAASDLDAGRGLGAWGGGRITGAAAGADPRASRAGGAAPPEPDGNGDGRRGVDPQREPAAHADA